MFCYSNGVGYMRMFFYGIMGASVLFPYILFAQDVGLGIAQTYVIASQDTEVAFGDIISSRGEESFYQLAREVGDEEMFGVTAELPAVVIETTTGGIPVVTSGEVQVNVTTRGGPIAVGDPITSSPIPGKGQRASDTDVYILGIALETFTNETGTTTLTYNGQEIAVGSVTIALSIGPRTKVLEQINENFVQTVDKAEAAQLNVLRHIVAMVIALGSIYFAFRNFGSNVRTGVLSIGRNPLAKRSIQSMVVLNVVLILAVSATGLFISLAIILLPL